MSAELSWGSGATDLSRDIANLSLAARAAMKPLIVDGLNTIKARVLGDYASRGVESVGRGSRVQIGEGDDDLSGRFINPSPLGHFDEDGTANRYTSRGWFRGRVRGHHTVARIATEVRADVEKRLAQSVTQMKVGSTLTVR